MNTRLAPSVERNICCETSSKQRRKSIKSENLQLANQKTQTEVALNREREREGEGERERGREREGERERAQSQRE